MKFQYFQRTLSFSKSSEKCTALFQAHTGHCTVFNMIQRNLDVEVLSIKQFWTLGQPINVMLQALYIGLKLNTLRRDDIMSGNARQFCGRLHEDSELQNDGSQSTERSSCLCFKGCPCSVLLDSWALPRGKLLDWLSLATRYSRGRYFLFIAYFGFLKI